MFVVSEIVRFMFLGTMALIGLLAALPRTAAIPGMLFQAAVALFAAFTVSSIFVRRQAAEADEQRGWHGATATVSALGMLLITFNHPMLADLFQPSRWMNAAAALAVMSYLPFGIREFSRSLSRR
ncbi:hypothetical protein [Brevundimonas sp.]|uniref:hypothetical protein n=1 Tax=Brevundimonas sp. TaxID=1871086 RepID=UPI002FC5CE9B